MNIAKKDWDDLLKRVEALEKATAQLVLGKTAKVEEPDPAGPVGGHMVPP